MSCSCNANCCNKEIDAILKKYENYAEGLIAILQKSQEIYGYLPKEAMQYIAEKTGIPLSKIVGVATFYAQFRLNPIGKNLIMLCQGTACHVNGSADIEDAICDYLGIKEGETTEDGLFTFNNVACLGCCSLSPVMTVNGETFGNLTTEKAVKALAKIKEEAVK